MDATLPLFERGIEVNWKDKSCQFVNLRANGNSGAQSQQLGRRSRADWKIFVREEGPDFHVSATIRTGTAETAIFFSVHPEGWRLPPQGWYRVFAQDHLRVGLLLSLLGLFLCFTFTGPRRGQPATCLLSD